MVDVFERIFSKELTAKETKGRAEGRAEERQLITDKLIAVGWDPVEAAKFTGLAD